MARGGISATSMNAWKACKRKFFYYKTVPFDKSVPFAFGIAFEHGVENYIKTGLEKESIKMAINKFNIGMGDINKIAYRDIEKKEALKGSDVKDPVWVKYITKKSQELVEKHINLLPEMIIRCKNKLDELGVKFIQFQTIMTTFLETGVPNEGRFDGVVEMEGKKYIFELKSYKTLMSKESLQFSQQLLNYAHIAREKGFEVDGVMFCQNKKSKSEQPNLLKNGNLSTAKTQKCGPEEYWNKAVEIYGEDVPDNIIETYEELLNKSPLVKIDILKFKDKQLDLFTKELNSISVEIKDMVKLIKKDPVGARDLCYPNYGNACNMCNHKLMCQKEMLGED